MQGRTSKARENKAKVGRVLLLAGLVVLVGEAWIVLAQAREFWSGSGAATLGYLAALGALAQKLLSVLAWNQGALLAAMAKVLVLCCPLLVIGVGLGMVRQGSALEASGAEEISAGREERR